MERQMAPWLTRGLALVVPVVAGCVGVIGLAMLCHLLGFASHYGSGEGYALTSYLQRCLGVVQVGAYVLLGALLGGFFRPGWAVALGMMLPWPVGCLVETIKDPTSHNLLPFEVIIAWLPAFALALMGTYIGRMVVERFGNDDSAGMHLTGRK
jgi:hypothetical protein